MALTRLVNGVRVAISAAEEQEIRSAWKAAQDAVALPENNALTRRQFLELLYDGREDEVKALLAGKGRKARAKARAYIESNQVMNWNDPEIVALRGALSEGEAAFAAAWMGVANG